MMRRGIFYLFKISFTLGLKYLSIASEFQILQLVKSIRNQNKKKKQMDISV